MKTHEPDDLKQLYNERDAILAELKVNRTKPPHDLATRMERFELLGKRATVESTIETLRGKAREAIRWEKEAVEWATHHEKAITTDQSEKIAVLQDACNKFLEQEEAASALLELGKYELPPGEVSDDDGDVLWEEGCGVSFEEYRAAAGGKVPRPLDEWRTGYAGKVSADTIKGATLTATPDDDDDDDAC